MERYLNTSQAGELIGCSARAVSRLINAGRIEAVKVRGARGTGKNDHWRIAESALEAYVIGTHGGGDGAE